MACHAIISDFLGERRMALALETEDFLRVAAQQEMPDPVLTMFADHPFFAGCHRWCDLETPHFHVLIINILKIIADLDDAEAINKTNPALQRLTFLLCSLVIRLEAKAGCEIDLLRVNRISREDVLYDFSARMEIGFAPPAAAGWRVVYDSSGD